MMKKKLWIRDLECSHSRPTNLAYMVGKYNKPKVGDWCFCRECCNNSKIIKVYECKDKEIIKIQNKFANEVEEEQ